ncbi:hypothetical protein BDW59DRAFT_150622 [Aspergillus cavernicola]|uniref:Secreted protein n=1 Tax=Aspergillus cavernicola TaxID=176166 RepID=A0ABR4I0K7_9EURO
MTTTILTILTWLLVIAFDTIQTTPTARPADLATFWAGTEASSSPLAGAICCRGAGGKGGKHGHKLGSGLNNHG